MRDNYDLPDGRRLLIASDRISAFDQNLAAIPLKGQVLTQTARFWFEATQDICANHVLDYPDPNVPLCRRLTAGVRRLKYEKSRDRYGEGIRAHEKASFTPTTNRGFSSQ